MAAIAMQAIKNPIRKENVPKWNMPTDTHEVDSIHKAFSHSGEQGNRALTFINQWYGSRGSKNT